MPKNSEGYDWEADKVSFMFVNLEHQGEDMHHSVNGRNFVIRDNKVNTAPRAVFNALNDCVRTEYKVEGDMHSENRATTPFLRKLCFVQIVDEKKKEEVADDKEKEKAKVIKEVLKEK